MEFYAGTTMEYGALLFDALLFVEFISRYSGSRLERRKSSVAFIVTATILFLNSIFFVSKTNYDVTIIFIEIIVLLIYSRFALKGKMLSQCLSIFLFKTGFILINSLTIVGINASFGIDTSVMMTEFAPYRMETLAVTRICLFHFTRIFLYLRKKRGSDIPKPLCGAVMLIPVCTIIIMTVIMKIVDNYRIGRIYSGYFLTAIMTVILINLVSYYLFERAQKEYEHRMENQILKANQGAQEEQSREIKGIRHDMNNQLLSIYQSAKEGQLDVILQQVHALLGKVDKVQSFVSTDDRGFDSIVNVKLTECEARGIPTECFIEGSVAHVLEAEQWACLIGNLMDNVMEASKNKQVNKSVRLYTYQYNELLLVTVSNTVGDLVLLSNAKLQTTKTDVNNHGFGMRNIEKIVRHHGGRIYCENDGELFTVKILLEREVHSAMEG